MFLSAIIIFLISLIGSVFLIANRLGSQNGEVAFISFPVSWDLFLEKFYIASKILFRELPVKVARNFYHFVVIISVDTSRKIKKMVYPKIAHIVEVAKGTDIPEQTKPASGFLKSISTASTDTVTTKKNSKK